MLTEAVIKTKLVTNQRWLEAGLVALYRKQTADEQAHSDTKHRNGQGFNSSDAPLLSYYAKYCLSGRHLSGKHLEKAQKRLQKYAKQLLVIALAKEEAKGKVAA